MSKKTEDVNKQAQAAQANTDKLADELGVSKAELVVIRKFAELLSNRVDAAPTEPYVSSAETHIKKRMVHNEQAVEALQVDIIETNALHWVEDNSIGRAIGGLTYPAPLDKAKTALAGASRRLNASPGDSDVEVSYAKAIKGLAQMQCQAQYKEALAPIFQAVYRVQTGGLYAAPDQTVAATSSDESLNMLLG